MENKETLLKQYQEKIASYKSQLAALRKDGVALIDSLTSDIKSLKTNKMISKEVKAARKQEYLQQIEKAKEVKAANASKIKEIEKEACAYAKETYAPIYAAVKEECKTIKAENSVKQKEEITAENDRFKTELDAIKAELAAETDSIQKQVLRNKISTCKKIHHNLVTDIKSKYGSLNQKAVDKKHESFVSEKNDLYEVRYGKNSIAEKFVMKCENYVYNFKLTDFLLKNGLYIIILVFMIICIISNPKLLMPNQVALIFKNWSTKVFFALGVAGLILFGGTDLSVGRMIAMGSLFTCMLLNPNSPTTLFGISFGKVYGAIGFPATVVLALVLSISTCVIFSLIAGFFTAKFKIHPFITTLGTSLIIWGTMSYGTSNIKTGAITDEASELVKHVFVKGSFLGLPVTIFYAIIAIFVVWLIWNKTKFGKNMYAVGGNSEAASVSGISVFKVTLGIFGLAGILYGVGAFLQALTSGSSSSVMGAGWELEAIAACVVGGISFSGGIGKVSGAVIGCLIFEILKYFLRDITGGSAEITNIFIGAIIIIAVTFDSIKYLKKK